jgi:hypothetical protein
MIYYFINSILATLLAIGFYRTVDGMLRKIMIALFTSFALYQGLMTIIVSTNLSHGTWYSAWVKLPFTISMFCLAVYMHKETILNLHKKCLNFLTQLRKSIQNLQ